MLLLNSNDKRLQSPGKTGLNASTQDIVQRLRQCHWCISKYRDKNQFLKRDMAERQGHHWPGKPKMPNNEEIRSTRSPDQTINSMPPKKSSRGSAAITSKA